MNDFLYLLVDYFSSAPRSKYTILTDQGSLLSIYPKSGWIQAHTPYLSELSGKFNMRVEIEKGYLSHGFSGIPVKRPRVGQMIYLVTSRSEAFSMTEKIKRIYFKPVKLSIDTVRDIFSVLKADFDLELIPGTYTGNMHTAVLNGLLKMFVDTGEWRLKLDDEMRNFIERHKTFVSLISAGYINIFEEHVIATDIFKILVMEAIHLRYFFRTEFDKGGILHLVD